MAFSLVFVFLQPQTVIYLVKLGRNTEVGLWILDQHEVDFLSSNNNKTKGKKWKEKKHREQTASWWGDYPPLATMCFIHLSKFS